MVARALVVGRGMFVLSLCGVVVPVSVSLLDPRVSVSVLAFVAPCCPFGLLGLQSNIGLPGCTFVLLFLLSLFVGFVSLLSLSASGPLWSVAY